MESFNLPFSTNTADPSLSDLLRLHAKGMKLDFNCLHIGTVQSFDADKQVATVTINYKQTVYQRDPANNRIYRPLLLDYPQLSDCPVVFLGGGVRSITVPVVQGDECLVFFNDRDLDNWFSGQIGGQPATNRIHSFSDALVLVGIRNLGKVISDFDTQRISMKNDKARVAVGPQLVLIDNDQYNLKDVLQELVNNVKSLVSQTSAITVLGVTTGLGVSGIPVNAAAITAISAQLDTTAGKLAALLEGS